MSISQFGHLAYTCQDLDASVKFYRDVLGLRQKFVIYYGDWLDHMKRTAEAEGRALDPAFEANLEAKRDTAWIAYFEIGEDAFVELFDRGGAAEPCIPDGRHFNFQHMSLVTDDIHALEQSLREKGAPIDSAPALGLEHTWQMWSHDPDGNKIEFMEYTPESWQVAGRE